MRVLAVIFFLSLCSMALAQGGTRFCPSGDKSPDCSVVRAQQYNDEVRAQNQRNFEEQERRNQAAQRDEKRKQRNACLAKLTPYQSSSLCD